MAVIGYARVSTADQSTEGQVDALTAAGAERVFTETVSARTLRRPELDAMLDYARSGDVIVVTAFDRLSRSVHDLTQLLAIFDERDLSFRSLREQVDTATSMGRFVVHIAGAFAELERSYIAERTRDGLHAARGRGAAVGRPTVLTDAVIGAIGRMTHVDRLSRAEIAAALRISESTVTRGRHIYDAGEPQ